MKKLSSLLVLLFFSFSIFLFSLFVKEINNKIDALYLKASFSNHKILGKIEKPINLIFVGDIMLDRGVEWKIEKNGNNDFKFPFLKIAEELQKADILFGNLEGPISNKGQKVGSIYSFRMDPKAIEGLVFAGFDILSVANNHMFDYSRVAMEDTFSRLRDAGIAYTGGGINETEAYSPAIEDVNGTKIAFLAFTNLSAPSWEATTDESGMALFSKDKLKSAIKDTKNKADIVVISLHFGDEYKGYPNKEQKTIAQFAVDSGADLVVGHHPHVSEPVEEYKGKYIAYSLGNFIFDQNFSEETMKGLMLKVVVDNNRIKEVTPVEFKINQYFQPEI